MRDPQNPGGAAQLLLADLAQPRPRLGFVQIGVVNLARLAPRRDHQTRGHALGAVARQRAGRTEGRLVVGMSMDEHQRQWISQGSTSQLVVVQFFAPQVWHIPRQETGRNVPCPNSVPPPNATPPASMPLSNSAPGCAASSR